MYVKLIIRGKKENGHDKNWQPRHCVSRLNIIISQLKDPSYDSVVTVQSGDRREVTIDEIKRRHHWIVEDWPGLNIERLGPHQPIPHHDFVNHLVWTGFNNFNWRQVDQIPRLTVQILVYRHYETNFIRLTDYISVLRLVVQKLPVNLFDQSDTIILDEIINTISDVEPITPMTCDTNQGTFTRTDISVVILNTTVKEGQDRGTLNPYFVIVGVMIVVGDFNMVTGNKGDLRLISGVDRGGGTSKRAIFQLVRDIIFNFLLVQWSKVFYILFLSFFYVYRFTVKNLTIY